MAIVCHCDVVRDREIVAAIEAGATSIDAVRTICGAVTGCGGCEPAVAELLRRHGGRPIEPLDFEGHLFASSQSA